jgi:hypothetical protein
MISSASSIDSLAAIVLNGIGGQAKRPTDRGSSLESIVHVGDSMIEFAHPDNGLVEVMHPSRLKTLATQLANALAMRGNTRRAELSTVQ